MMAGVVAKTRNAFSSFSGSAASLSWKRAPSSSGQISPIAGVVNQGPGYGGLLQGFEKLTILRVLSGKLGNSITNFVANEAFRLGGKGLENLLSNDGGLVLGQRDEQIHALSGLILAGF